MQRKGGDIMMRKGFSMITAIFFILIMATISILVLNLTGKITKETTILYRQEQAALLARSYTELAVMAVLDHNRSVANTCIEDIDGVVNALKPNAAPAPGVSSTNGGGYKVETRIYYLGNDLSCSSTRELTDSSHSARSSTRILTPYNDTGAADSIAAIIVDVYVKYKDASSMDPSTSPWITYHRRTLQKI